MIDAREHRERLVTTAARLWAGEAEVVRAYFLLPRSLEQDLFWLTAQAYKEAYPLRVLPEQLGAELLRTGGIVSSDGPVVALQLRQEARHYRTLADLIGELRGSPLNLSELKPLSEDAAMQEVRAAFANNAGALERAAVGFTEGGGGVMFCELARLEGSPLRRRIAAIFKEIYLDELSHSWPHLDAIERHARNEADWRRAEQIVATICRRRVRMRNEMFGNPLGIAEMRGIEAGKLEPWKAPSAA